MFHQHRQFWIVTIIVLCIILLMQISSLVPKHSKFDLLNATRHYAYIAVIVDDRANEALVRAVLNVIKYIPEDWPVQILTLAEHRHYLEMSALKYYMDYGKVFMTALNQPKRHSSIKISKFSNTILTSPEFWQQIPGDKVLMFHTDSTFCSNSKYNLSDFLKYDFIGAPWAVGGCCNGGFSLRSRIKILQILNRTKYSGSPNEDGWYTAQLKKINGSVAPKHIASMFSVETIYHPYPLAIHKPLIKYLGFKNMQRLCNECLEAQRIVPFCTSQHSNSTSLENNKFTKRRKES